MLMVKDDSFLLHSQVHTSFRNLLHENDAEKYVKNSKDQLKVKNTLKETESIALLILGYTCYKDKIIGG